MQTTGPARRDGLDRQRRGDRKAALVPAARPFEVLEHRPGRERDEMDLDAGLAQESQLVGEGRLEIDADHGPDADPEPRHGQRPIRHRAAESPAARISGGDVTRGRAGDQDERSTEGSIGRSIGRHDVSCWAIPA